MRSNVQKMSSSKIDRFKPNKTLLIIEEIFVDDISRILEHIVEGRKASHNNFSSEPYSPHFLVRATSKFSSFAYYYVFKCLILEDKAIF